MAGELSGAISTIIPSKASLTAGTASSFVVITIFIIVIIIFILGGIGVWLLIRSLQFNKKIDIYEDRGEGIPMQKLGKDRAKEITYSKMGDSVFYLKKRKKFVPRGEIKSGRNFYIYVQRTDGELMNASLESVTHGLRKIGVHPIHPDMRAFKDGMEKVMTNRFEKKNWIKDILGLLKMIAE